eukprot:TRINITY_DN2774_c0_g1_i2.p1 TRINITY_DN2774_c0_g1~~TRINITY_DN2774_c0_g1_i2.p1  ORF type:complete len:326 (+),score=53.73 TRINITY_DN2774_c0_g1_i2:126-1103(+)
MTKGQNHLPQMVFDAIVIGIDLSAREGDFGRNSWGLTCLGMRVGYCSERCLTVGVNLGLGGVGPDGGCHMGVIADIGIGYGVSVATTAQASWGKEKAGAAARAVARTSGCEVEAATAFRSTKRNALEDMKNCRSFLQAKEAEHAAARRDADNATASLSRQQMLVDNIGKEVQSLQEKKVAAGKVLINKQSMLAPLKRAMLCVRKQLAQVADELEFALTGDETKLLLRSKDEKQALATTLEGEVRTAQEEVDALEKQLKDAHARWESEHQKFQENEQDLEHKEETVRACENHVRQAKARHEAAEKKHRDADETFQAANKAARLFCW